MKNIESKLVIIFLAMIMFACGGQSNTSSQEETEAPAEEVVEEVVEMPKEVPAVCIWDKIAVREVPGGKKWLTSLNLGESLKSLGMDSTVGDKNYTKVLLNDGKEGWAITDFIVTESKPTVMLKEVSLYSRPDLLTKTDKKFSMMDIVAGIENQGDWLKVRGKRSEGKWIDEGWIKSDNVSFDAIDIAGAKFASAALKIEDEEERLAAIDEVINNADLAGSKFITELSAHKEELLMPDEVVPSEEELVEEVEAAVDSIL